MTYNLKKKRHPPKNWIKYSHLAIKRSKPNDLQEKTHFHCILSLTSVHCFSNSLQLRVSSPRQLNARRSPQNAREQIPLRKVTMPLKAEWTGTDFHPPLLSNSKSTPIHKHVTLSWKCPLFFPVGNSPHYTKPSFKSSDFSG